MAGESAADDEMNKWRQLCEEIRGIRAGRMQSTPEFLCRAFEAIPLMLDKIDQLQKDSRAIL